MRLRTYTHPRHFANRLEPGIGYDVIFLPDLDGAIAFRSRDEVFASTCRAAARAGFEARRGPRGVSAAELAGVAPNLLWVNPTAADLSRLRWRLPPSQARGAQTRTSVRPGSAAIHEAGGGDTAFPTPAA